MSSASDGPRVWFWFWVILWPIAAIGSGAALWTSDLAIATKGFLTVFTLTGGIDFLERKWEGSA